MSPGRGQTGMPGCARAGVIAKRWLKIEDKSKVLELRNGLGNIAAKGNTTDL